MPNALGYCIFGCDLLNLFFHVLCSSNTKYVLYKFLFHGSMTLNANTKKKALFARIIHFLYLLYGGATKSFSSFTHSLTHKNDEREGKIR